METPILASSQQLKLVDLRQAQPASFFELTYTPLLRLPITVVAQRTWDGGGSDAAPNFKYHVIMRGKRSTRVDGIIVKLENFMGEIHILQQLSENAENAPH